jgi:hypothetical protein
MMQGFSMKKVDMLLDMVESLKIMSKHSHSSSAGGVLDAKKKKKKKRGHPSRAKEGREAAGIKGCSIELKDEDRVSLLHPRGDVPCSISVDTSAINHLTQSNPMYTWDHRPLFGDVDQDAEFLVNYSVCTTTDDHVSDGLDHNGKCNAKSNMWLLDPDMSTLKYHHEDAMLIQHSTNPLFLTTPPEADHVPSCDHLVYNNDPWTSSDSSCLLDVLQKRVHEVKECIQSLIE